MRYAIRSLFSRCDLVTTGDNFNALGRILEKVSLGGLWRTTLFEHAATPIRYDSETTVSRLRMVLLAGSLTLLQTELAFPTI